MTARFRALAAPADGSRRTLADERRLAGRSRRSALPTAARDSCAGRLFAVSGAWAGGGAGEVFFPERLARPPAPRSGVRSGCSRAGSRPGWRRSRRASSQMISASAVPGSSSATFERDAARIGQLDGAFVHPGLATVRFATAADRAGAAGSGKRAARQYEDPFAARRTAQRLVAFRPLAANPVARGAGHVEILDFALGLGRELLEESSCPAEELQESPRAAPTGELRASEMNRSPCADRGRS